MRKIIFIISIIVTNLSLSQQVIKPELPTVTSPSPTVAALMKYEEIPVSNYTGIPNISIPLFNYKFPSHKMEVNVGLSYHSASTKLDEVASDIGLGWSLTCGGSISRTVIDLPDEFYKSNTFGIYRTNPLRGINYYQTLQTLQNANIIDNVYENKVVGPSLAESAKEFLWEKEVLNKYDIQHDMWQYNFNGNTGRFYIEKQTDGSLQVKLLENTTLKIVNHYNIPSQTSNEFEHYKPTGFTIYDENGYKYIFDVIENSNNNQFNEITHQNGNMNSSSDLKHVVSAFHLSKIYDQNNKLLVENYYTESGLEHIIKSSTTQYFSSDNQNLAAELNNLIFDCGSTYGASFLGGLYKPSLAVSISDNTYLAKKIEKIKIMGVGNVYFNYETGRLDDDYINKQNVKILKGITVKDTNNLLIKDYILEHEYKYATKIKLFLKEVIQIKDNNSLNIYKLFYKEPRNISYNTSKDLWGYLMNNGPIDYGIVKEADKDFVSMFALEKMVLPTGGCIVFEYESNTYSYQGNQILTDFDGNFYNWNYHEANKNLIGRTSSTEQFFTIDVAQHVFFQTSTSVPVSNWFFSLYKATGDPLNPLISAGGINDQSTFDVNGYSYLYLEPGTYYVQFTTPEQQTVGQPSYFSSSIGAHYRTKKTHDYKHYFYGGGFRIANISTYEENINVNNNLTDPLTRKHFKYFDIDSPINSSGVLVNKKPVFKYETYLFRTSFNFPQIIFGSNKGYTGFTNYDKHGNPTTKGSAIGYKNVTIFTDNKGLNNGKSVYSYTTTLDYPNEEFTLSEVFLPSINYDYKRGLLKKEELFDNLSIKKVSKTYNYEFENYKIITGLRIYGTYDQYYNSSPILKLFPSYSIFKTAQNGSCSPGTVYQNTCNIDSPPNTFRSDLNIGLTASFETYGWAKLTSTNTKEYFYPSGSSTASIVETNQTYTYNPINKQIAESTVTNSNGEILKTNYYYHTGNSTYSQNRISEIEKIETYRNGQLLSTSKINYANNWGTNVSYLPQTIQSSKGANALETKVKYNKYDEFSNPLEVQQEGGIKISYIWGYNNTQPVAKLENIAYDAIPSSLITAIQSATDSPTPNEITILNALNALRTSTDVNLQKAMITTYTYKPLVGITSVTDPKGDKQTYHYDSFNRLEFVKDKNGNILSENKYHYRTQN